MVSVSESRQVRWQEAGIALVLLLAAYRLLVLLLGDIPLDTEEVYYLSWTDRLEFGYFSKPPLLPALLGLVTGLFGESAFVIKSISLVLHTATALVVFAIARELYDARTAAVSAVGFQLMPIVGLVSLFTSTDAALLLFWSLTLWGFIRAVRCKGYGWWLFTGLMAGLGLMSKYTMGVLALGLLGYLLLSGRRELLWSRKLWAGLLVAVLVCLPHLVWLTQHEYITLSHTRYISGVGHAVPSLENLRDFLLSQILVFGPVLAIGTFFWIWRRPVWQDDASRLLLFASLPMLVIISLQAWLSEANINWASPTYIGLLIVATHWMLQHARRWLYGGLVFNMLLLSLVYHYHAIADTLGIELTRKTDPYFKRLGWEQLGEQLARLRADHPGTALLSSNRQLLAQLGYHAGDPQRLPVYSWNPQAGWHSQYDLYRDVADHPAGPFLLISSEPVGADVLQRFASHKALALLRVSVYRDLKHQLHVYRVAGFKGYR